MSKIKAFMDRPITWGGYAKFTGIVSIVSIAITAISYGFIFRDQIIDEINKLKEKLG